MGPLLNILLVTMVVQITVLVVADIVLTAMAAMVLLL
jgi:hypothetical protein